MPALVRPSAPLMASFVEALGEGYSRDTLRPETPETIAAIAADPDGFLGELLNPPATLVLPDGTMGQRVPATLLWWTDGDRFLSSIQVRHYLNAHLEQWGGHIGYAVRPSERGKGHACAMLAAMLDHVRAHLPDLTRVILTASQKNPASCRVIEKNGGVLERAIPHPWHDGEIGNRYGIAL
jgi:predicted acetyltransferase